MTECARTPGVTPRAIKVRLFEQLPADFSPDHLDPRLYSGGRLTPIGLRLVDPDSRLLKAIDQTIRYAQNRIRTDSTLTEITAVEIARDTELTEAAAARALFAMGNLGHFFSQAHGTAGNEDSHASIQLADDTAYDEYLRYRELDELIERVYVSRGMGLSASLAHAAGRLTDDDASHASGIDGDTDPCWPGVRAEVQRAIEAGWSLGVPSAASALYGRWWQLETWLRSLIYVELRAKFGAVWASKLPAVSESRQQGEKGFRYMETPDAQNRLAYTDASVLFRIIDEHWDLFEDSLLSRGVWNGRVEELKAIRNRIGHCRRPHTDDLARIEQTLRDLTPGAFSATTAFNRQSHANAEWTDAVVDGWVRRAHPTAVRLIDHAEQQYKTIFELRCSRRPWAASVPGNDTISAVPGYLWHAFWYFKGRRSFDLRGFWRDIEGIHDMILLVCAESPSSINVSFSALDDADLISKVIGHCFDAALYRIRDGIEGEDLMEWQRHYSDVDPRVHVSTAWSSIDPSMRGVSIFSA